MEKEAIRRPKISQSLIGNTRRLGHKVSEETKRKQSLALKGKWAWNKGKNLSYSTCHKMSLTRKGVSLPWMRRPRSEQEKQRLSESAKLAWNDPVKRKRMLDRCKWNNMSADKGQIELLNKWNGVGFHFEPNYQLKTDTDLFYIDGYDREKNVVLEYDSKYHSKEPQRSKDLIRQKKIIDILHPKKFWRYNAMKKQWRNVLEGQLG